jgi:hypothetical protein
MLGHHAQGREQCQRLEVIGAGHATGNIPGRCVDAVSEEQRIEFSRLGDLRQALVVGEVQAGIGWHLRMTPGGDVVPGRHQEGAELELTSHGQKSLRSCTPK